jgi:hypothetical protein
MLNPVSCVVLIGPAGPNEWRQPLSQFYVEASPWY